MHKSMRIDIGDIREVHSQVCAIYVWMNQAFVNSFIRTVFWIFLHLLSSVNFA